MRHISGIVHPVRDYILLYNARRHVYSSRLPVLRLYPDGFIRDRAIGVRGALLRQGSEQSSVERRWRVLL